MATNNSSINKMPRLTYSVILSIVIIISSALVSWGTAKTKLDSLRDAQRNTNSIVLKKADTTYVDKAFEQHMKLLNEKFKSLESKMDIKFEAADKEMKLRFENLEKLLEKAVKQ